MINRDDNYIVIAKADQIPIGGMKHFDIKGKEILLTNINGEIYAISNRCAHMNALLSMGHLNNSEKSITCGFHKARFNVTTGR